MEEWKDLLAFNRTERRGIWLLLVIIGMATALNIHLLRKKSPDLTPTELEVLFERAGKLTENSRNTSKNFASGDRKRTLPKDSLFYFDPNTLSVSEWMMLGLSARQAEVITRYTEMGGRFKTPQDLKKSFVISGDFYKRIEPWITIAPRPTVVTGKPYKEASPKTLDINLADTLALQSLAGVGSVLAARIVRYRESLGGFFHLNQLREVFGLSPEVIDKNAWRLTLSTGNVNLLEINKLNQKALESHPYISKKLAYSLVTLREEKPITSREDLQARIPGGLKIPDNLWPYLHY